MRYNVTLSRFGLIRNMIQILAPNPIAKKAAVSKLNHYLPQSHFINSNPSSSLCLIKTNSGN